jgi:hypothetical protein
VLDGFPLAAEDVSVDGVVAPAYGSWWGWGARGQGITG